MASMWRTTRRKRRGKKKGGSKKKWSSLLERATKAYEGEQINGERRE